MKSSKSIQRLTEAIAKGGPWPCVNPEDYLESMHVLSERQGIVRSFDVAGILGRNQSKRL